MRHPTAHRTCGRRLITSLAAALCVAACGGGVTDTVTPPPTDSTPTNPGGTVQRTSLTVNLRIDPADAAIANTAGVSVAGLAVRLTKAGTNDVPLTSVTDAGGTVTFDRLLDGLYTHP